MTISILNDCLLLRNEPLQKLHEYFQRIGVDTFEKIFNTASDELVAKQNLLYILCAFSEESPLLVLRQDTKEEKIAICEYLQIPEFRRRDLMELRDPELRKIATQYLIRFAGPIFKSYKFLQIQVEDIEIDITNRAFVIKTIKEGKGEEPDVITETFDIKEHSKAVTEYARLCKALDSLEKQMRMNELKRMDGIDELKNFTREGKQSGRLKGVRTGNVEGVIH